MNTIMVLFDFLICKVYIPIIVLGEDSELVSSCGFEYRVVLCLNFLPSMARKLSLLCYLNCG